MGQQESVEEFVSYRIHFTDRKIIQKLSRGQVAINDDKRLVEENFPLIRKWYVSHLHIQTCASPHLLKHLKDIEFVCLGQLTIKYCQMESMEILSSIQFHELKRVSFSNNYLRNITSFRKSLISKMIQLSI